MTTIVILLAIILSTAVSVFLLNGFVESKLRNKISKDENPISISYFKGILFVSSGLLFSEVIPTFKTLTKVLPNQLEGSNLVLEEILFYCIFLGITLVIFLGLFWLSTLLLSLFNKGESIFAEIAKNNLNSVVLFLAILLAFVLAVKTAITPLLDEIIPYPEMLIYR